MKQKNRKEPAITSRRAFIKGASQVTALALLASGSRADAIASVVAGTAPVLKDFELAEATVAQLQEWMRAGRYTARSLVQLYLEQIDYIDKSGPAINSVIELNPDALVIAETLDMERKERGARGPLHGIPVLIKDNIDTADRMKTTAGSLALLDSTPTRDAFLVQRLRAAGAVILGKTNLSEWANFRSTRSTSGWSGRGGQTKNPYALDRNPCGSSSGSGAAAAANLCTVAIGTETDGSIVCPSTVNSLVGIKPTLGLVSRTGIIPISHSQDTAGPMTRTVADAAALLTAITGADPADKATRASQSRARPDYTRFLDPNGLKGARLGIIRKSFGFNDRVAKLLQESIDVCKRLGAVIIENANIPTAGKFDATEFEVLLFEFKNDLNAYLASRGAKNPYRTLKDLIAFNEQHRDREMPFFSQEIFLQAEEKGPLTSPAYRRALAANWRLTRTEGIDAVMNRHRLDALIAPTGSPAWPTDVVNGDHFTGGFSSAAAVAGYPHITVPAGFIYGLPVGLSFVGRAWSEPKLLALAYSYEQATMFRRPPKFLPTAASTM